MAGLAFIFIVCIYLYVGFYILDKVQKKYQTKKTSLITLALIILIPTWDVILGFPIYASLCLFQSGPKIYKTVDNVEGYYIGEVSKHSINYLLFEEDYKYKDYKLKSNGKYYRSYWLDNNISELCIKPDYSRSPRGLYPTKFRNAQCIAVKEISKNNISKWEVTNSGESTYIPIIRIKYGSGKTIYERKTGEIFGKNNYVTWCASWVSGSLGFIVGRSSECGGSTSCGGILSKKDDITLKVLKVKKLSLYNQPKKLNIKDVIPNYSPYVTPNSSLPKYK